MKENIYMRRTGRKKVSNDKAEQWVVLQYRISEAQSEAYSPAMGRQIGFIGCRFASFVFFPFTIPYPLLMNALLKATKGKRELFMSSIIIKPMKLDCWDHVPNRTDDC